MLFILHVVGQEFAELGLWNLGHLNFPILYCQMRNHIVSFVFMENCHIHITLRTCVCFLFHLSLDILSIKTQRCILRVLL